MATQLPRTLRFRGPAVAVGRTIGLVAALAVGGAFLYLSIREHTAGTGALLPGGVGSDSGN